MRPAAVGDRLLKSGQDTMRRAPEALQRVSLATTALATGQGSQRCWPGWGSFLGVHLGAAARPVRAAVVLRGRRPTHSIQLWPHKVQDASFAACDADLGAPKANDHTDTATTKSTMNATRQMAAPMRAAMLRRQTPRISLPARLRHYSAEVKLPSQQQPSFMKTFSRPIFKVALMAIFTYQLVYYGWMKLETDEVRTDAAGMLTDPNPGGAQKATKRHRG